MGFMAPPAGGIILWSGAIVDIPGGYVLCDGNNGAPDLRNKFVVGAGDTYAVGASGGALDHIHTGVTDNHFHEMEDGTGISVGGGFESRTGLANEFLTTDLTSNLPPYYALAYIMKT